jgi:hypothetical protein
VAEDRVGSDKVDPGATVQVEVNVTVARAELGSEPGIF